MSEIRSQATPARDELAADIFRSAANIDQGLYEHEAQELANRLLAAGWSKPRTVNSAAELDALPMFTVIRSEQGSVWERQYGALGKPLWIEATQTRGFPHTSDEITLPATVLFTPGDAG
ncbi:UNVERIFIED_ORG: hypothetical protein M2328_006095 [Rhodococcus erythropolis]